MKQVLAMAIAVFILALLLAIWILFLANAAAAETQLRQDLNSVVNNISCVCMQGCSSQGWVNLDCVYQCAEMIFNEAVRSGVTNYMIAPCPERWQYWINIMEEYLSPHYEEIPLD